MHHIQRGENSPVRMAGQDGMLVVVVEFIQEEVGGSGGEGHGDGGSSIAVDLMPPRVLAKQQRGSGRPGAEGMGRGQMEGGVFVPCGGRHIPEELSG